jgi:small-conductance mechanosensitive channel
MPDNILAWEIFRLGRTPVTPGVIVTALLIIAVAAVLSRLAKIGLSRLRAKAGRNAPTLLIVEKLVTYGLIVVGIFVAMNAVGLDLSSFAVFAGALGVGVGLGLQGVVKEFVSGLVLIFDRVLNVGDYVEIEGGVRGTVQEIGPRATRFRNNDNVDILVPNSKLVENPITNWTFRGHGRRIHIPFSVDANADKAKVRDVVLEAAHKVPFTLPDDGARKAQVWMIGWDNWGMSFELLVWPTLDAVKRPAGMQAAYTWAIDDALRAAGIAQPRPGIDLALEGVLGLKGEAAREALKLQPAPPTLAADQSTASASSNDAVDDLVSGGGADTEPEVVQALEADDDPDPADRATR